MKKVDLKASLMDGLMAGLMVVRLAELMVVQLVASSVDMLVSSLVVNSAVPMVPWMAVRWGQKMVVTTADLMVAWLGSN